MGVLQYKCGFKRFLIPAFAAPFTCYNYNGIAYGNHLCVGTNWLYDAFFVLRLYGVGANTYTI